MSELDDENNIIKKQLFVIKEVCSWLQTFYSSNPDGR